MGMSYINESLAPNETLIYFARFHWLRKAVAYAALAVFVVIAMASLVLVQDWPGLLGAAVVSVVGLAVFIAMMMPIWTTEIGVTNHRFILKRGWLRRATDELQLTSIEEVNLDQSVLGRLLGYGHLVLHGTGVNDIKLPSLADPVGLRRALQEGMGAAKAAVVVVAPSNGLSRALRPPDIQGSDRRSCASGIASPKKTAARNVEDNEFSSR